jgi:hypothetical protein
MDIETIPEVTRDNKHLVDDGGNQRLTASEIEALKTQMRDGHLTGKDLVDQLCQNSATFDHKNEFSQQKYLRRKKQKYVQTIRPLLPTSFDIVRHAHRSCPTRVKELREDSLAALLSAANIHPGMSVLVYDTVNGLLTGTVLVRLDAQGELVSIRRPLHPHTSLIKKYNLTQAQTSIWTFTRMDCFIAEALLPTGSASDKRAVHKHTISNAQQDPDPRQKSPAGRPEDMPTDPSRSSDVPLDRRFDAAVIILVEPFGEALLEGLLKYMRFSRQVVFFSPYKAVSALC